MTIRIDHFPISHFATSFCHASNSDIPPAKALSDAKSTMHFFLLYFFSGLCVPSTFFGLLCGNIPIYPSAIISPNLAQNSPIAP